MPIGERVDTPLGVRWTLGDVSDRGFAALRLSILGAVSLFGPRAAYAVCVNTIPLGVARARIGPVGDAITWLEAGAIPPVLSPYLDTGLAEGVAWKLAPLRLFPGRHELSLDNDCILWRLPPSVRAWLDDPHGLLLATDVRPALGRFEAHVGPLARNTGIRGLPPGFDLAASLRSVLSDHPGPLISELDEQGLQVAALGRGPHHAVTLDEVAICSPFPPHAPSLGTCGAHFVGLNVHRERPYCDLATMSAIAAFWDARRPAIEAALI